MTKRDNYTDSEANNPYRDSGLSDEQIDKLYANKGTGSTSVHMRGRGLSSIRRAMGDAALKKAGLPTTDSREFTAGALRPVKDPDKVYADMTRGEYLDYVKNYRGFEEEMLQKAKTDTSLVDQARQDVSTAGQLTKGIADRNASRYGATLTRAQQHAQLRALGRSSTLGGIQAVSDAKIAQKEANTGLLSDLINIGQGVNRASQSQMGSAAADATARKNAYEQARAASKAQTYSTIGSLGAAAIFAFAF